MTKDGWHLRIPRQNENCCSRKSPLSLHRDHVAPNPKDTTNGRHSIFVRGHHALVRPRDDGAAAALAFF
jgi:hypothetical protein